MLARRLVARNRAANLAAARAFAAASHADFFYEKVLDYNANPVSVPYRKLTSDGVSTTTTSRGDKLLCVDGDVLTELSRQAIVDIQHLFRPAHLQQLSNILKDPESSSNDRFIALELLKNACVSAGKIMPSCQDTGTATVLANRGQLVLTDSKDEEHLSKGIYRAYTEGYLRYSQVSPKTMFDEVNTKNNLPAQIDMMSAPGDKYEFLFVAKGGGSANKTQLFQKTKSVLTEEGLTEFIMEQVAAIGTAACPPYHLAVVIGGLSAEMTLKTVKLASCKYLDGLPTSGGNLGKAFRDLEWEERLADLSRNLGIGAQFGGKYFVHDCRVIRLPRHGASCPIGLGVSCSADRQAKAKITEDGVFLEELETEPAKYLPDVKEQSLETGGDVLKVDLNQPMEDTLNMLRKYPVATRVSLTGTMIVARDWAHAKINEKVQKGEGLPEYMKKYPVYYAGPAKTPAGMATGSFGPTTSGRMDPYVGTFQALGGSMLMIGKGNRAPSVTKACKTYGGIYLGSIGGVAATVSVESIKKVEVLDMEELGMEAVWKIDVEDFPAFIVIDDKGNDFFKSWSKAESKSILQGARSTLDHAHHWSDPKQHRLVKSDSGNIKLEEEEAKS